MTSVPPLAVTGSTTIGVADGVNDAVTAVAVAVTFLPATAVRCDFLVGVLTEIGVEFLVVGAWFTATRERSEVAARRDGFSEVEEIGNVFLRFKNSFNSGKGLVDS